MSHYISRSFNKGRDGDLVTAAHRVVVSLKDNTDFPCKSCWGRRSNGAITGDIALHSVAAQDKDLHQ
jgi:hypothetical protein